MSANESIIVVSLSSFEPGILGEPDIAVLKFSEAQALLDRMREIEDVMGHYGLSEVRYSYSFDYIGGQADLDCQEVILQQHERVVLAGFIRKGSEEVTSESFDLSQLEEILKTRSHKGVVAAIGEATGEIEGGSSIADMIDERYELQVDD